MPSKKAIGAHSPFVVSFTQQVAAGSMLTTQALFTNPSALKEYYELLGVDVSYDVVSTSGTMDLRRVPASTAFTGGDRLIAATISSAAGARTATKVALATAAASRQIRPGDTISLILAGTQTNLVGLTIVLWLQAIRALRAR